MPDALEERLSALAADLRVPVPDGLERAVMDRVASDPSAPAVAALAGRPGRRPARRRRRRVAGGRGDPRLARPATGSR